MIMAVPYPAVNSNSSVLVMSVERWFIAISFRKGSVWIAGSSPSSEIKTPAWGRHSRNEVSPSAAARGDCAAVMTDLWAFGAAIQAAALFRRSVDLAPRGRFEERLGLAAMLRMAGSSGAQAVKHSRAPNLLGFGRRSRPRMRAGTAREARIAERGRIPAVFFRGREIGPDTIAGRNSHGIIARPVRQAAQENSTGRSNPAAVECPEHCE
jgi:hypothetical protein